MDKKLIKNLSIWGSIFVIVIGSLVHFMYGWSANNYIVGFIAPINESPWEHMKMVFTPFIIFAFVEFFLFRGKINNYCFALAKEVGAVIAFILVVFYLYTSIVGNSVLWVDISSFVIGIILAKWFGYKILTGRFKKWEFKGINSLSAMLLIILTGFFIYATINPPHAGLFRDPNDNTYGINKLI